MEHVHSDSPIKNLRKLIHAEKCFRQIERLCKYLENSQLADTEEAYVPAMAGICVIYAIPFAKNDGLGPIPDLFTQFPEAPQLDGAHQLLLNGPSWIARHHALTPASVFGEGPLEPTIGRQSVVIQGGQTTLFSEDDPVWNADELREIIALCRFQISRTTAEARKLVAQIAAGSTYKIGVYPIGEKFPRPKRVGEDT